MVNPFAEAAKGLEKGSKGLGGDIASLGGLGKGGKTFGPGAKDITGAVAPGIAGPFSLSGFPLLRPVQPPARRRRRSTDPFDFFGTLSLFNPPPATQGLSNPTSLLNQTV